MDLFFLIIAVALFQTASAGLSPDFGLTLGLIELDDIVSGTVQDDVRSWLSEGGKAQSLVSSIATKLSSKYPNYDWGVHVYNDWESFSTPTSRKGSGNSYRNGYFHLMRIKGKSIVVSWSRVADRTASQKKLQEAQRVYWGPECGKCEQKQFPFNNDYGIAGCLQSCLSTVDFTMVLVARAKYGLKSQGSNRYLRKYCGIERCFSVVIAA